MRLCLRQWSLSLARPPAVRSMYEALVRVALCATLLKHRSVLVEIDWVNWRVVNSSHLGWRRERAYGLSRAGFVGDSVS